MADEPAGLKPVDDTGSKPADDEPLREGGKRALDAERAARREAEKKLRDAEAKIQELELADVRREVAADKGLTEAQSKRLAGSTKEELEADADELLEAFGRGKDDDSRRAPREQLAPLRSGASNEEDPEPDVGKVADRIFDRGI